VPPAGTPLPRRPGRLARRLTWIGRAVDHAIEGWIQSGPPDEPPPRSLVLQSLYQQRIYRLLARKPRLARRVVARLDLGLRARARLLIGAGAHLRSLVDPIESPVTLRLQKPQPPAALLAGYKEAERRFGVDRYVLASINYVESKFGRVRSASPAGARGPMQFLPSTWAAYGLGGDIEDPRDAILGAANYLKASGAPADYRRALLAYNHAGAYVDAVLLYARAMRRDVHTFYYLYNWQVFTITAHGDVRVTGPGHRHDKWAVVLP
jgi:soluble lytic murein transglycosylase-like protein